MNIQSLDTQLSQDIHFYSQSSHRQKSLNWMKMSDEDVRATTPESSEYEILKNLETGVKSRDNLKSTQLQKLLDAENFSYKGHYDNKIGLGKLTVPEHQIHPDTSFLQTIDPVKSQKLQGPINKRIFTENASNKLNSGVTKAKANMASFKVSSTETSLKMDDSIHQASRTSRPQSSVCYDKKFRFSAQNPENELNFIGGLGPCVGYKRSDKNPQRPTTVQKIFRMRTRNYPVTSLTENPRKSYCAAPRDLQRNTLLKEIVEKVAEADNCDTESPSATSLVECEEFDLENPFNLDLQGQDYRQTYENDEQEIQNAREYHQQLLHMKRKRMQAVIAKLSKDRERKNTYAVPEYFDPDVEFGELEKDDKGINEEEFLTENVKHVPFFEYKKEVAKETSLHEESDVLAKLFRTTTKVQNQEIIENELNRRSDRYYQLWLRRKQKENTANEKQSEEDRIKAENLVMELGEQFFEKLCKDNYQECLKLYENLPPLHVKRSYPHTLRETKRFKQKMAQSRKIIREKALIRTKILESRGITKNNPEIPPEAQPVSSAESLSEQSTDDEDDLYVGKTEDEAYQLRGFHFKLDSEPRGLKNRKQKSKFIRPPRTCQTRSSWLRQLVPDKNPPAFFQYNPSSLKRSYLPNDPNINLFPSKFKAVKSVDKAPIKEYLRNSSLDNYAKRKQVRFKIKKPRYIKVKKFTLTGYLYGAKKQKKIIGKTQRGSAAEHVGAYSDDTKFMRRAERHQRLRYLGIPFNENKNHSVKDSCESSETESSEWIPDDNEIKANFKGFQSQEPKGNLSHLERIANMPAPKFREPTLRNHPRRPRVVNSYVSGANSAESDGIYTLKDQDKIPLFQKVVSPRAPYDIPRLAPIPPNAVRPANLEIKKTAYTQLFNARHHHCHNDPTNHKNICVRYKNKLPDVAVTEKSARKFLDQTRPVEKACPSGTGYKQGDFTLPKAVTEDETMKIEKGESMKSPRANKATIPRTVFETKEESYKTRQNYQDDLPGKSEYIEVVRKMAIELRRELENIKETGTKLAANEEELAKELIRDVESIDSCVTSLESSTCTNFTNDSGSFIMIQDKKIPCDYITKSFVPFEEIDRIRVKAALRDAVDEYNAPYFTVPFSGQKQDQINLAKAKDKFYTHKQRSRVGLRQRLEVRTPDFKTELLGTKNFKAPSKLATEYDERFQHEIRNRPSVTPFKRRTTMMMLRDSLRKKFETLYMREQITEQQIVQQKQSEYAKEIINLRNMCQDLFQKWQERHYHTSMLMIEKIKPVYQKTDLLKKRYQELEKQMIKLNMRIVFIEDDWIRRTILQNFHYLIMEQNWRLQHDWIHLQEDGTLENFRTSINKRKTVNIRNRGRDDAWAIKEYYETVYLPNKHPIEIVFPDAKSFNDGVNKLKARTFICLLEMHFSMWVLANLEKEYNQFTRDSQGSIEQTSKVVRKRGASRYFMEDRAKFLDTQTHELIGEPLQRSIASPRLRTIEALCDLLYVQIIPQHVRNDVKEDCSALDKLQMVFGAVTDVLGKLDRIPTKQRDKVEKAYRKRLAYNKMQSQKACLIEKRIQHALEEVKRNMAPPYKKLKREGKLPRVIFQKKTVVKKEEVPQIFEKNKLFIQAFTESDTEESPLEGADSDIINSLQDNCIPFYFDHFLRLHDYEPNYDFKTQVDLNEGPEENRLMYKDVINNVMKGLEAWQLAKKKKMEADIQKTMYLYIDSEKTNGY